MFSEGVVIMDKKNVVLIPATIPKNKGLDKFGGWDWMTYSIDAWKFWCKKNDCELVIYDKPSIEDLVKYKITIQRWFDVFDFLDKKNINYDQIAMVDACSIPHWNCSNFFELTGGKFTAGRDMDNLRWIYESIEGYKNFFEDFEFNLSEYVCCQFTIFNESHREFFTKFKQMYLDNIEELTFLQKKVKRGTDQTPFNYMVQMNNIEVNYLSQPYRLSHLPRKEMLGYNWQLNEDTTPFFIKYGYIWFFSGFDKQARNNLMKQTWDLIKHNYTFDKNEILLNSVNHKNTFKNATSRKFKEDLIEFFGSDEYKDMSVVELGACQGDTTKIFSSLFKNVYACDWSEDNVKLIAEKCKDCGNVDYEVVDVTNSEWKFPKADVVFIDASHDYPQVAYDIEKAINYFDDPIIILDDYGNPNNTNIRMSVEDKIGEGKLKIHKTIGEYPGFKTKSGWEMVDREGIICNV